VFAGLELRRAHRATLRRVQVAFLAIAVLGATAFGFVALRAAFGGGEQESGNVPPLSSNGQIVFSRVGGEGRLQLFVAQPDGSETRVLTQPGPFDDLSPAVSPDGTTVAFQRRFYGEGFVIASVPIAGGDVTELTERALPLEPAWSPDGSRIAFAGSPGHGPFGLWVMDADGSNPRRIAGSDDFDVLSPTWSPDGSRIAFVGFDDGAETLEDIFSVTPEGDGLIQLTHTPGTRELTPGWSPDGRTIAFVRSGGDIEGSEIWTVRPDGSASTLVERTDFSILDQLAWSPDGTTLLATFEGWVHLVDVEEGGFVRLLAGASAAWQPIPEGSEPAPTPDPTPTAPPEPEGKDIGLGFNLCDAERLGGIDFLGDGTGGVAWVGVKTLEDGTCPVHGRPGRYAVAEDHTGDGIADSWLHLPWRCDIDCTPFDATDLDTNGSEELIVTSTFSIMSYYVLGLKPNDAGELELRPFLVAEPGYERAGLVAGEPLRIDAGGDEGYGSQIECEGYPEAPVLIWSWSYLPVESEQPMEVHITRIQLGADGRFHVIGANDYTVPFDQPSGIQRSEAPACGVDWHPNA
jgi:Tol biopolymer transport system component